MAVEVSNARALEHVERHRSRAEEIDISGFVRMAQVLAQSTGRPLAPVDAAIAERVRDQTLGERMQSELFFEALRRTLPGRAPSS